MTPGSLARAARRSAVRLLAAALVASAALPGALAAEPPLVAAAADLRGALDEVAARFTQDTGGRVRIVYGSSGNFRRQIAAGAPFELFLSADESMVQALARSGLTRDDGVLYALGRLALVLPAGSPLKLDPGLADLAPALADGRLRKFAIANPEHAPYGLAARQALTAAGVWTAIAPRLVLGENVAQAAQFALSGSTQGGIVALSLAAAPAVLGSGRYVPISETLYAPLRQRMVLLRRAGPVASRFYDYLQQPAARAILQRHAFALPGG
jgi:molybdate transport system substrate-binding protein